MSETELEPPRISGPHLDAGAAAGTVGTTPMAWSRWRGETGAEFRARVMSDAARLGVATVKFSQASGGRRDE